MNKSGYQPTKITKTNGFVTLKTILFGCLKTTT
jgi:hypothetical protein